MNNNVKGLIILIALISSLASFHWFPFYSSTVTCYAIADASTCSPPFQNEKYGTYDEAQVGADPYGELGYPNWYRYFFMKFDLSSIPSYAEVSSAKLYTYCHFVGEPGYYEVTKAYDDTWSETTICWANQPSIAVGSPHSRWIESTGWYSWNVEFYIPEALTTDKLITLVLVPDRDVPEQLTWCNWRTKEHPTQKPYLIITYTIPSFTLTVSVKDADGQPVQGASVTSPFTATTDTSGLASASLSADTYTVKVEYKGISYTKSVTLDSDKTVTITIPKYDLLLQVVDTEGNPLSEAIVVEPVSGKTDAYGKFSTHLRAGSYTVTVAFGKVQKSTTVLLNTAKTVTIELTPEYTVTFIVKDQVGNPLPATIKVDEVTVTADTSGHATQTITKPHVSLVAEIKVKDKTYSSTETLTLTKSITKEIIINRRFYWTFFINYTDGSLATGTLTASSAEETLTTPITNGWGEAYLTDTTYSFTFEASPAVTIGTVKVVNDGDLVATINKEEETAETSHTEIPTTSPESPTTTPEIPWVLIPSVYIYGLLGVLVLGFMIAAVVRLSSRRRKI